MASGVPDVSIFIACYCSYMDLGVSEQVATRFCDMASTLSPTFGAQSICHASKSKPLPVPSTSSLVGSLTSQRGSAEGALEVRYPPYTKEKVAFLGTTSFMNIPDSHM